MEYLHYYASPLGRLVLCGGGDDGGESGGTLTGLWFERQAYFGSTLLLRSDDMEERALPVFDLADRWLDAYFSGRQPDFMPPLRLRGTEFRRRVWNLLQQIPWGQTVTYGQLARQLAPDGGRMSAQAVGGAVGHNPIGIIVPCHRVVGSNGSLTGYAAGLERKKWLLLHEGVRFTSKK